MVDSRNLSLDLTNAATIDDLQSNAAATSPAARTREPFQVRSHDGTTLAGDAQGDPAAPEILFIHGLRQSRLSWDKQFADPALSGFRLVRFDLRGHGDSDKPTSPSAYADPDRWGDDLAAVIAGAKLRRPVLVGWSLGGWVVGGYLRRHTGRQIAGLNLVGTVVTFAPELFTPLVATLAQSTVSPDLATRTAATAEFLLACFHHAPSGAELAQMMVINGMAASAINTVIAETSMPNLDATFRGFDGPVLLTHGAHDRLVRPAASQRLLSLCPNARLSMYENSGHSPFYEEPDRFGCELAAFVSIASKE